MAHAVKPRVLATNVGLVFRDTMVVLRRGLSLMPDDRGFVALLAAWVVLIALVTYILLGCIGAGVILSIGGIGGIVMVAAAVRQGQQPRRALGGVPLDGENARAHLPVRE
jgi:hypothetical protein